MHENIVKTQFYKDSVRFYKLSINRDMVLKWKLGQLVWTDLLPFVSVFSYGLFDWPISHCVIFAVQLTESRKTPH